MARGSQPPGRRGEKQASICWARVGAPASTAVIATAQSSDALADQRIWVAFIYERSGIDLYAEQRPKLGRHLHYDLRRRFGHELGAAYRPVGALYMVREDPRRKSRTHRAARPRTDSLWLDSLSGTPTPFSIQRARQPKMHREGFRSHDKCGVCPAYDHRPFD